MGTRARPAGRLFRLQSRQRDPRHPHEPGQPSTYKDDNGIWQDGALFIHFPNDGSWLAFFLAFQSQFAHTDHRGDPIPGSVRFGQPEDRTGPPPLPAEPPVALPAAPLRIVAALVNPAGHDPGQETVTLLNTGPEQVDLAGWALLNGAGDKVVLLGSPLGPGETVRVRLDRAVPLSDQGGTITLLDPAGLKVHGVAYTGDQMRDQGWTLAFRG